MHFKKGPPLSPAEKRVKQPLSFKNNIQQSNISKEPFPHNHENVHKRRPNDLITAIAQRPQKHGRSDPSDKRDDVAFSEALGPGPNVAILCPEKGVAD